MAVRLIADNCSGCKLCLRACPYGAIEIVDAKAFFTDACNQCGACASACKFGAIEMQVTFTREVDTSQYHGLWVIAEHLNGEFRRGTYELLGEGRRLADKLGTELSAVLLGENVEALAADLIACGADKVYLAQDPVLAHYRTGPYTDVLAGMIHQYKPEAILVSATPQGRDLAPRVAARVGAGLTADCTGLDIDPAEKLLVQTRPAFGGNLMATIVCRQSRPQMSTVRPGVMKSLDADPARIGEVVTVPVKLDERAILAKVVEIIHQADEGKVNLQDAAIIVSGGRGPGQARKLRAHPRPRRRHQRRRRRLPRRGRRRLDPRLSPGRPNRPHRPAQTLHRLRHLRRGAASGGHELLRLHHRHQQRPRRPDLQRRHLRHRRRPLRNRPEVGEGATRIVGATRWVAQREYANEPGRPPKGGRSCRAGISEGIPAANVPSAVTVNRGTGVPPVRHPMPPPREPRPRSDASWPMVRQLVRLQGGDSRPRRQHRVLQNLISIQERNPAVFVSGGYLLIGRLSWYDMQAGKRFSVHWYWSEDMADDKKFSLPGSGYDVLEKVLHAYAFIGDKAATLDEVTNKAGLNRVQVSSNHPFLSSLNLIQGGRTKRLTVSGTSLVIAISNEDEDAAAAAWQKALAGCEETQSILHMIKVQGGVAKTEIVGKILQSLKLPKASVAKTGANCLVEVLRKSNQLKEEGDRYILANGKVAPQEPEQAADEAGTAEKPLKKQTVEEQQARGEEKRPSEPSVHIDVQIHISPDAPPEQVDQIFASMAKHLYGR